MSTLKVNTLQTAAGVEVYTAKAWVNFNGTGTVAIRASGNVTSITDNGTGDYTVNFTNALPDANYCVTGLGHTNLSTYTVVPILSSTSINTTDVRIRMAQTSSPSTLYDTSYVFIAVHR
jgi:hypothetical protein